MVLARGTKHSYADRLPGPNDIVLAIEVADRSPCADCEGLGRLAWFGIPGAWIINLVNGSIEVDDRPMGARARRAMDAARSTGSATRSGSRSRPCPRPGRRVGYHPLRDEWEGSRDERIDERNPRALES